MSDSSLDMSNTPLNMSNTPLIMSNTLPKIRVAAYCRVSTDKEEQEDSYGLQESYYREYINAHPNMELVGIYGDKGKSGLHMTRRPGLQKLLFDCKTGKIDTILTKSISRFARNMYDCAAMIRALRGFGVNVIFEKENLDSKDQKSSLILNIFAAIAEEESHSISLHTTLAHEQYVLEGRPFGRIPYGYWNVGNNVWGINEHQALRVRTAFQMASKGMCYKDILNSLNATETEGINWTLKRLKRMLRNLAYKGDYYSHALVSLVPGKQVVNDGYRDRYYLTGHHEAIVEPELFDKVQEILNRGILRSDKNLREEDRAFLEGLTYVKGANHSADNEA